MFAEVEQALRYAGDPSSGPRATVLQSSQFEELLDIVLTHLEQASSDAISITNFWLKEGHPAYPVFWDVAFVIIGAKQVVVFIRLSSD
jgi:hypothetical protein